jgi:DNA-binding NarL/FixJ family response regulator
MKSKQASIERPDAPSRKRVFIVEDHPVFRQGLVQMVNAEQDLSVCGQASDAAHALMEIVRLKPELALVDISLPGKSGLELIKDLRAVNRTIKLLVVSMHDEALYADRVLRAGGDGYIMKQEDLDEILQAIRDVLAGRIYVSEEVMAGRSKGRLSPSKAKTRPLDELTDSELELLEMLGKGRSNQVIARKLGSTVSAIKADCSRMKRKLSLKNDSALLRYAVCWVETGAG